MLRTKWVFYGAGVLGWIVVVFLLLQLGPLDFIVDASRAETEPAHTLSVYLTFVGVMLSTATVVLAAVAIGIGVVAAYTVQDIGKRADDTVKKAQTTAEDARKDAVERAIDKVEEFLSKDALDERARAHTTQQRQTLLAELEEDYDPEDTGNR